MESTPASWAGTHHRGARVGPGEEEAWLVGTTAHPVVARAVGRPDVDREVGDRRVGDGVDHHRPVLDDAPLLVLLADHVARRVLEEQQGDVDLVGQLDELGRLVGFLGEEHAAVVGQHPDRIAVDRRPPGHQAGAVERLELVEPGAVDDPGEHLAGIEGHLRVGGGDPEQLLGIVDGLVGGHRGARALLAPVEAADDLAPDPNGVELVGGELVGEAGDPGVHRGAAELLVGRFLAGRHLDQGRAPEEDLGALLDHHDVVAHARHVCAPCGRVAEDERNGGERGRRPPGEVAEGPSTGDEQLCLRREVGAARLDQVDRGKTVLERDVGATCAFPEREGVHRAAPHRRVVRRDEAFGALHDADAEDGSGADVVLGSPCRQGGQLEERRVAVQEELDPLAGRQLSALAVSGDVALAATGASLVEFCGDLGQCGLEREVIGAVRLRAGVDVGGEDGHERGSSTVRRRAATKEAPGRTLRADVGRIGPWPVRRHRAAPDRCLRSCWRRERGLACGRRGRSPFIGSVAGRWCSTSSTRYAISR